ncbi:ABC transporter family substrate-binding protein [Streptomyces sp. SL13]|uniref:ABC transporter family substrate-binding protein n=1 Tax=Streptantibioticus silvisoli TaxID=2705255 RepID=A0AA90H7S3_9ACTN|nr:ABC transporter family substrate-binding protein [Streptantibioticus silvisoli]MDI5963835.1 ABC transporter family substrate-binding protein [Streptantibioticus silvisoli]MDI5970385.1 ABC transporter family substrate-binding protein [Streptantibioticus silvisoli]
MRRTTVLAIAATLTASLVMTACGPSGKPAAKKQAPSVGTSEVNAQPVSALRQGGTLKVSIDQWISQYNSNTADGAQGDAASITAQVEPTLFLADAHGVEQPDPNYLLSAKVTSTSPQVVTYTLNPKARWSDGKQLSWRDFQAQWKALNGTDHAFQGADPTGYDQIGSVVRGANDQQAKVTFTHAYADWKRLFNPLFPASAYSTPAEFNNGWVDHVPVSAGPFKVGDYDKTDQTITLVPDPKWWGPKPVLSQVIYRVLDIDTLTQAFLNKEIDLAPAELPEDYQQLVKDKNAVIETGSRWDEVHITLNGGRGPLKDVRVRQAVEMAVNRRAITDAYGSGIPYRVNELGNHFYMPNQKGYRDNSGIYGTYDPKAAAKLLDAAGWKDNGAGKPRTKDGKPLELAYPLSEGSNQASVDQSQLVQQMLGQVGIKVDIDKVPANDFFNKYINVGDFDLASFRNVDELFPSELHPVFQQPKGDNLYQNFGSVGSPQIDALLDQAQATTDPAKAVALYNQVDVQLWKLGHSIELYQRPQIEAVRKGLANYGASGLADTDWTKVGWQK